MPETLAATRITWGRRWFLFSLPILALLTFFSPAGAQQSVTFDPAHTTIEFTLGATLHTVHGTFRLKQGAVQFDPATGKASGSIVIDATSGETGNSSRDHNMHTSVLESAKYPEIVFLPERIASPGSGVVIYPLPVGKAMLEVTGDFRLHGRDHEMTVPLTVEHDERGGITATAHFSVPYVKWGLKNPSTFVLRVGDTVDLEVRAVAKISP